MPSQKIEMIPIDSITVINPRVRNRKQHSEIIDNIKAIGLKKPISVSRAADVDGEPHYNLVCGQGRLEAFRTLGQRLIPAIVCDISEEDCLLKSIVENVARRQHTAIEQLEEVGRLRARGHSEADIANQLGVTQSWISMITGLLDRGEQRLLVAVESGLIPLSLAVDIARSSDGEIQDLLTDAYAKGIFRGKKLAAVRRMLEARSKRSKTGSPRAPSPRAPRRKPRVEDLRRIYETEAGKHRILIKKADFVQQCLLISIQALKHLFSDSDEFVALLETEGLHTLPRQLDERIAWRSKS